MLNGHSYAGQLIQGPAEAGLDYRVRDDKSLQF